MRIVTCPRCGRENRSVISLTLCDRCGHDISTLPSLLDSRPEPEAAPDTEPIEAAPPRPEPMPPSIPAEPVPPRTRRARSIASVVGRLLFAGLAVGVGGYAGKSLTVGSALAADRYIAGSVAILAAAAGLSGLVIMLVGGGRDRSQSVTLGLRGTGFLLAVLGIWAVTSIAYEPARQARAADQSLEPASDPGLVIVEPGEMGAGPGTAMPAPAFGPMAGDVGPSGGAPPGEPSEPSGSGGPGPPGL